MKRRKVTAQLQLGDDLLVYKHGTVKVRAAVYHTVTYRPDLCHGTDAPMFGIREDLHQKPDGIRVIVQGLFHRIGASARHFVLNFSVNSDSFAQPFGQHITCFGVDELVFHGTGTGVYDQYIHRVSLLCEVFTRLLYRSFCPKAMFFL